MRRLKDLEIQYKKILSNYISNQHEHNLYNGQNFIRQLMKKDVMPEDVINLHKNAVEQIFGMPESISHSYNFLIEIMVNFGLKVKDHQSLILKQEETRVEMEIASKIQGLLLETTIPNPSQLDIGKISIPKRKMNGDYVHFQHDRENYISVAVTDVVGKGVPAALCMSMVKYGLDTLGYANNNPSYVLEVLNKIIEKSVDDSMFVSLFYGRYDLNNDVFTYGSAGHEPALYYQSEKDAFHDLEPKGLLLGIMPGMKYSQEEIHLLPNDFIMIMTDGVTDFRKMENPNARSYIKQLALSCRHLSAQQMCEVIYQDLKKLQNFILDDDFTLVIIKK